MIVAVGVGGPLWIVGRDWSPPAPAAVRERGAVLTAVRTACGRRCDATAVRRTASGAWIVRVRGRRHAACLRVDPRRAEVVPARGLVGASLMRLAACQD